MKEDDGKLIPKPSSAQDWRDIAARASTEPDPQKLSELVQQLCDRLDQIDDQKKKPPQSESKESQHRESLQEGI
jgi:hypothetical protein